jgi:hypothetical protein
MENGEGRIAEHAPEPLLQLSRGGVLAQLDDQPSSGGVTPLGLELPGDEPDRDDAFTWLKRASAFRT